MPDPNAGLILILRRTQPWVRIASIVGFLLAVLVALFGAHALLGGGSWSPLMKAGITLVHFGVAAALFVPSVYLHKYANRITPFMAQGHTVQLEAALEAQRRFWKFAGMFAPILLIAVVLAIVLIAL